MHAGINAQTYTRTEGKVWHFRGATGSDRIHPRMLAAFAATNDRRGPTAYGTMRHTHADLSLTHDQDSNQLLPQAHPASSVACLASAEDAYRTPNGLLFRPKHSRDDGPGPGLVDTDCASRMGT